MWLQPELLNVRQRNIIKQMTERKKEGIFLYMLENVYKPICNSKRICKDSFIRLGVAKASKYIFTHGIYISTDKEFITHQNEIDCGFISGLNFFSTIYEAS